MELNQARLVAERVVETLRPVCHRIEIAGSIRRQKATPKDIEIVVVPRIEHGAGDLFGQGAPEIDMLCLHLQAMTVDGKPWRLPEGSVLKPGLRLAQFWVPDGPDEIKVDLFCASKDNWGSIYGIRTGAAEFVAACLGIHNRRGYFLKGGLPYRLEDGIKKEATWKLKANAKPAVLFPTEDSFFEWMGLRVIPPVERTDARAAWKAQRTPPDPSRTKQTPPTKPYA